MEKGRPYRLLVLAAKGWNDYDFLKQEFMRLASIHRHIIIVWPDGIDSWQIHVRDWCKNNTEQFTGHPYIKSPNAGHGNDLERDMEMFWTELPDEVWKIESTKAFPRRPDEPVWPHLWGMAQADDMTCVMYSAPRKRNPQKPVRIVRKRKQRPA